MDAIHLMSRDLPHALRHLQADMAVQPQPQPKARVIPIAGHSLAHGSQSECLLIWLQVRLAPWFTPNQDVPYGVPDLPFGPQARQHTVSFAHQLLLDLEAAAGRALSGAADAVAFKELLATLR